MRWNPRVGQVNAVLLSLYFPPLWGGEALRSLLSPVYGLSDRVNLDAALFYDRLFNLGPYALAPVASVLVALKLLAATLFVAYAIDFARGLLVGRETDRSTMDGALLLAASVIVIWGLPAYLNDSAEMIRLYATQFLLVMGAVVVTLVEPETEAPVAIPQPGAARPRAELGDVAARLLNGLTFATIRKPGQTR